MLQHQPVLATALLTSLAVGAPAHAAPEKSEGAIRIATYNIENLFDQRDDPGDHGRYDDWHDERANERAKPQDELIAVAEADA